MTTKIYSELSEAEKRQIRMFGCTEAQMRDAVEESLTFRFHQSAAIMAASLMSDAQEEMKWDVELARQTLNRAKWIIVTYSKTEGTR